MATQDASDPTLLSKKRPLVGGGEDSAVDEVAEEFSRLNVYGEHTKAVSSVKFAPSQLCQGSSVLVASASAGASIKLWELKQQYFEEGVEADGSKRRALKPVSVCQGHSRGINEICWNHHSALLASASDDKTVRIWDATTGDSLSELKGHENFVFCVDQQHTMVVSGSFDETRLSSLGI
jgi:WD40 repeat protein